MIRLILLLNCLFLFAKLSLSQGLEFYREDLTFYLKSNSFEVDGIYFFCNTSQDTANHILLYPFPEGSGYKGFDTVSVVSLEDNSPIIYKSKKDRSGITFHITVLPYKTTKVRISYRQKLSRNTAEYILMTTHAWKKPFEIVNYHLIVDDDLEIKDISIAPDSIFHDSFGTNYIWRKRDFMPNGNMKINFEFISK